MTAGVATGEREAADRSLVERVLRGDRQAFELLMRRYNKRLYRLARASLHDKAEAEDALQDAYLSAYRSLGQFRGDAALATWLSRLVLNECENRRRRSARRHNIIPMVSLESSAHMVEHIAECANAPESALTQLQLREVLERKVGELPDILRVAFVMRSVEELSVEETAELLGIPQETVRSRHFRAKALLRESLAREVDIAERDIYEFGGPHCDALVAKVLCRIGS